MKKIMLLLTLIITFIYINDVYATTYQGTITGTSVTLRKGPGTNYGKIDYTIYKNQTYNMPDNILIKTESGCNSGYWYKIKYDGSNIGYVCSSYVSVSSKVINSTATTACEQDLKAKGFPASYWTGLCALKNAHPNWNFQALDTNLDWSTAVSKESTCGKSYIASTDPNNINYNCTNQYKDTWYPASSNAVAYYMDPRNFFSEKYIFQFLYLKYGNSISSANYVKAVSSLLSHAAFYKYHGNGLSTIIDSAGKPENNDVSPMFIAARMLQELGSKTTLYNLYSGVYSGFTGYYNFFNIGVSDSCATTYGTTVCGLNYAKNKNWYGVANAINGGVSMIANEYINVGQYTTYLQKFNVKPNNNSSLYVHQYQTNIGAPSSESSSTYSTYSQLGLLNSAFTFYIPVYDNMADSNYKNDGASPDSGSSNLSSANINTILTSAGFKTNGSYILGIQPKNNVKSIKNKINAIGGSNSAIITNKYGKVVNDEVIGTGYKITVKNKTTTKTFVVIINGDTTGDGLVNPIDLLQVQKKILGTYMFDNLYLQAADTNDDGLVNALDLLQVQKHILGTYTIKQ